MSSKRRRRIAWKRILPVALTLVLGIYLVVGLNLTSSLARTETCKRVEIVVNDTTAHPFVTAKELNSDLGNLKKTAIGRPIESINTYDIERRLRKIDKIETANVVRLTDGTLRIDVTPMKPVARVFDGEKSYYINKDGKRIVANARYHVDVPVIIGRLDVMKIMPDSLLPLINYIQADQTWRALVSAVKIDSRNDVLLVPVIRGHVINLGNTSALPEKFNRLHKFYTEVMPYTGWNKYDTISVKWRGQIVATRANKGTGQMPVIEEDIDEADDATTMLPTDDALKRQVADSIRRKVKSKSPDKIN